jgi:hypothetical protein
VPGEMRLHDRHIAKDPTFRRRAGHGQELRGSLRSLSYAREGENSIERDKLSPKGYKRLHKIGSLRRLRASRQGSKHGKRYSGSQSLFLHHLNLERNASIVPASSFCNTIPQNRSIQI